MFFCEGQLIKENVDSCVSKQLIDYVQIEILHPTQKIFKPGDKYPTKIELPPLHSTRQAESIVYILIIDLQPDGNRPQPTQTMK